MSESDREEIEISDSRYFAGAIESGVETLDGDHLGHVSLLDLDDRGLDAARFVARRVPGLAAVIRSSMGSYHVWDLSIRPFAETVETAAGFGGVDSDHIGVSESRGCWVVRVEPKRRLDSAEEIKPQPRLIGIEEPSGGDRLPHSQPHIDALREMSEEAVEIPDSIETVGETAERRLYMADIRDGGESR